MTNLDAELAAKENAWQPYRRKQQQHEQVSLQLMTHLDAARVSRIKDDFGANGNVVDLYEFLRLPPTIILLTYSCDFGPLNPLGGGCRGALRPAGCCEPMACPFFLLRLPAAHPDPSDSSSVGQRRQRLLRRLAPRRRTASRRALSTGALAVTNPCTATAAWA